MSQQLHQVQTMLSECAPGQQAHAAGHPPASRAEISNQIKVLEAALLQLPDTVAFERARKQLSDDVAEAKRKIIDLKPVGARMDACKEAIERATQRRMQARETLRLASEAVDSSEAEVARLGQELAGLEKAVAQEQDASSKANNSLEQLESGMTAVITDMSGSRVDPSIIAQAKGQMQLLFESLKKVSASCAASAAAEAQQQALPAANASVLHMLQANARPPNPAAGQQAQATGVAVPMDQDHAQRQAAGEPAAPHPNGGAPAAAGTQ